MKPLIYGYLRVTDDLADHEIRRMERGLQDLAEAEGFRLATIFHEDQPGYQGGFTELTRELQRADAHHVVVPSLGHLSPHPLLRDLMLTCLAREANAHVWVVAPWPASSTMTPSAQGVMAPLRRSSASGTLPNWQGGPVVAIHDGLILVQICEYASLTGRTRIPARDRFRRHGTVPRHAVKETLAAACVRPEKVCAATRPRSGGIPTRLQ